MPICNRPGSLWLVATSLLCALGCADARGRFEDFESRLRSMPDAGLVDADSGPCAPPEPNAVGGPALLALETSLIPGKPILFFGAVDTPALEGTTAVHVLYRALDALDRRTPVGLQMEIGPIALPDGVLDAKLPQSTLDGRANPEFYGTPATSEMTLNGRICGVQSFYCGTLDGVTTGLLSGPFTGHFGITLLSGPAAIPDRPRFGCDPADLADPLAPNSPQP